MQSQVILFGLAPGISGKEDAFESIIQTTDGDILATGYCDGLAEGTFLNWGRGVLLKTNTEGKEKWMKDLSAYTSSGYRIKKEKKFSSVMPSYK